MNQVEVSKKEKDIRGIPMTTGANDSQRAKGIW